MRHIMNKHACIACLFSVVDHRDTKITCDSPHLLAKIDHHLVSVSGIALSSRHARANDGYMLVLK